MRGASDYNGHLRGPVTLTPFAERLAVELLLHVFMTKVRRRRDSNTQSSACGVKSLTHCATAAVEPYRFANDFYMYYRDNQLDYLAFGQ